MTANDYTVTYASNNDAVAKVENGKVTIVGEGETNIVATIKPTETNKYKETSATFAVKVEKSKLQKAGSFTTSQPLLVQLLMEQAVQLIIMS